MGAFNLGAIVPSCELILAELLGSILRKDGYNRSSVGCFFKTQYYKSTLHRFRWVVDVWDIKTHSVMSLFDVQPQQKKKYIQLYSRIFILYSSVLLTGVRSPLSIGVRRQIIIMFRLRCTSLIEYIYISDLYLYG